MKTKDEQLEIFKAFLTANSVLSLWIEKTNETNSLGARNFIETTRWEDWIVAPFAWCNAPSTDWDTLHNKWVKITKKRVILPFTFNVNFWNNYISKIKSKFKYLRWRFKFKKIKFYSLRNITRCHSCDALSTCPGPACPCNKNEQLKLRKKKK